MLSISDVESGAREARLDLLFSPLSFPEPYKLYHKPDVDTAYWRPPGKGEVHIICIGGQTFKGEDPEGYARALAWHELAHARFTERDLQLVNEELSRLSLPFSLFNLLEDARIEERFRKEAQLRFEWTRYEEAYGGPEPDADGLFFRAIQLEGDEAAYYEGIPVEHRGKASTVFGYWQRSVRCANSRALYKVAQDWIKEFPHSTGSTRTDGLADSVVLAGMSSAAAISGATEVGLGEASPKGGRPRTGGPGHPVEGVPDADLAYFLDEYLSGANPLDSAEVRVLVDALRRGLPSTGGTRYGETPGRRIKAQRLAIGKAPYRVSDSGRPGRGRRKVSMVLDCSGSMCSAIHNGRLLAAALSQLAKDGEIEGQLILSKGGSRDTVTYATVRWPVPNAVLEMVAADGGIEGLEHAIRSNRDKLVGHTVLVYSDGCIGDDPILPESLRGLNVMGVYCGEGEDDQGEAGLRQYFSTVLARETLQDIACSLAQELRRM